MKTLNEKPEGVKDTMSDALTYWHVGSGRYMIQSRIPQASARLRRLKGARRAGYAVTGGHLTLWALDASAKKLRSILRGLDSELRRHATADENQQEGRRAVLMA